jgi:hypothetical protein
MSQKTPLGAAGVWSRVIISLIAVALLTSCQSVPSGPPAYGLEFDGVDDCVSVGNSSSLMLVDALTISCWLKTAAYPATNRTGIIAMRGDEWGAGWYGDTWQLCLNSSGYVWGAVTLDRPGENPVRDSIVTSAPIPLDTWVHVTYTWQRNSPTGKAIYLNGQIDSYGGSRNYSTRELTKPAWIGGHIKPGVGMSPTDVSFSGIISELRIYSRALNATEVERLYNGADITSGLVGYWKFNEGSGTVARDSTANNNTGTLVNGPVWYRAAG